jgi:hypothetical protein
MAKPHRGKGSRELFAHGRGECPVCKRDNVKILYEVDAGDQKLKICKTCKAAVKHGKKSLPVTAKVPAVEAAPAEAAKPAAAEAAPVEEAAKAEEAAETPAAAE